MSGSNIIFVNCRNTHRGVAYVTVLHNRELISLIAVCVRPHYDVDLQGRREQHLLSWKISSHGSPDALEWAIECTGTRMGDRNGEMILQCLS